jgi:hypothetical protein
VEFGVNNVGKEGDLLIAIGIGSGQQAPEKSAYFPGLHFLVILALI